MKDKGRKGRVRNEETKKSSKLDRLPMRLWNSLQNRERFSILIASHRGEFYNANSLWFPLLTNILLSIRPWFYLHMATDARRKAIVYVTVVASCPMCPTYVQSSSFGSPSRSSWKRRACSIFVSVFLKFAKNLDKKKSRTNNFSSRYDKSNKFLLNSRTNNPNNTAKRIHEPEKLFITKYAIKFE